MRVCVSMYVCYLYVCLYVCPFFFPFFLKTFVIASNVYPFPTEPASAYILFGKCRHRICKCDAAAAKCFKRAKYNEKYRNYPKDKCV